jgi:hypothetical protein
MADGITRIAVEGFKSIAKRQEIEIAPLTILAGANSSGKSSIMQPLLMLKQTLEATYDPGPLKIDGPNVKFTDAKEFLARADDSQKLDIEIGLGENLAIGWRFQRRQPTLPLHVVEQWWTQNGKRARVLANLPGVVRGRFDLSVDADVPPPLALMRELIDGIIHVPSLRGTRDRLYPVAGVGPLFPGTFDFYHASVILHWQKDKLFNDARLNEDLQKIGVAHSVFAHRIGDVAVELRVGLLEDRPYQLDNIADVGFGVSQVLPVLVALRTAEPGRLVYIEEPEIHLHPRAQTELADILAHAAMRDVRVVAETHSSLLLRAVQTLVAKGDLDPDLVRLHWFKRDAEGVTQVNSAKPDTNGAFGDWPEDFGDVALESEQRYLDAVEDRLAH